MESRYTEWIYVYQLTDRLTEEENPFSAIADKDKEFAGFTGSAWAWC